MYCKDCGTTLQESAIFALMGDLGAQISPDPSECPQSEDGKHNWTEDEENNSE